MAEINQRIALRLLRLCGGAGLLTHYCRTVETPLIVEYLKRADADMLETFKHVVGMTPGQPLAEHQLIRIGLPLTKGGYGLRASAPHAKLAFYASLHQSVRELEKQPGAIRKEYLEALNSKRMELRLALSQELQLQGDWDSTPEHLQTKLSEHVDTLATKKWDLLVDELPVPEALTLRTLFKVPAAEPVAASWLDCSKTNARLRSGWNQDWDKFYFGMAVRFTLGIELFTIETRCRHCNAPLGGGTHLLHAKHGPHTKGRTEAVLALLEDWIERFLGRLVRREARSDPKSNKREGDIAFTTLPDMPRGTIFLDHCCVSILTPTNEASALAHAESLLNGIQPPRSITSSREDDKIKKYVPTHEKLPRTRKRSDATALLYRPIELRPGHFFIPVSSALFGGLGPIFSAFPYLLGS